MCQQIEECTGYRERSLTRDTAALESLKACFGRTDVLRPEERDTWTQLHGKDDNELYYEAYLRRVRSSHAKIGQPFDLATAHAHIEAQAPPGTYLVKGKYHIMRSQIKRIRLLRNIVLIKDFAEEHNIRIMSDEEDVEDPDDEDYDNEDEEGEEANDDDVDDTKLEYCVWTVKKDEQADAWEFCKSFSYLPRLD
jgi:hypothetical protein